MPTPASRTRATPIERATYNWPTWANTRPTCGAAAPLLGQRFDSRRGTIVPRRDRHARSDFAKLAELEELVAIITTAPGIGTIVPNPELVPYLTDTERLALLQTPGLQDRGAARPGDVDDRRDPTRRRARARPHRARDLELVHVDQFKTSVVACAPDTGDGWRFALLVACSVEKGQDNRSRRDRDGCGKVSANDFAPVATRSDRYASRRCRRSTSRSSWAPSRS
jgi:hypothetical protein